MVLVDQVHAMCWVVSLGELLLWAASVVSLVSYSVQFEDWPL